MRPDTEHQFAALLDRRLRRHNERLWAHLIAWSEVLGALGWCVAVKDAADYPQLNQSGREYLKSDATLLASWSELVCFLANRSELVRPIHSSEVEVWAPKQQAASTAKVDTPALTPRETEVIGWLRTGKSGPEIAIILGCSSRTIESHIAKIYRKLGIHTRAGLLTRSFQAE